jgi:putative membrane protein
MDINNHLDHGEIVGIVPQLLLSLPFLLAAGLYIFCTVYSNRCCKKWPFYRTACWGGGVFCTLAVVGGPLANRSHMDFRAHMIGHLLLGMLAPLLMVLAAPMMLFLRTLPVALARDLSRVLKSRPVRIVSDPIVAALLNVGGLWILYTYGLYVGMQHNLFLHIFIHFHVFLAGYLFTLAMISVDPAPHRPGFVYRAIVLALASGGHAILAKYIYVQPPSGVPVLQAEMGGMIMYYGGDIIDIIMIIILCFQWFKATRPRGLLADNRGIAED